MGMSEKLDIRNEIQILCLFIYFFLEHIKNALPKNWINVCSILCKQRNDVTVDVHI